MIRYAVAILLSGVILTGATQVAGTQGPKIKIGDTAPNFTNLPGVDGRNHSLADYKQDVLVVAITCNHCPVAVAYEDRMIAFAKKYTSNKDSKVGWASAGSSRAEIRRIPAINSATLPGSKKACATCWVR